MNAYFNKPFHWSFEVGLVEPDLERILPNS